MRDATMSPQRTAGQTVPTAKRLDLARVAQSSAAMTDSHASCARAHLRYLQDLCEVAMKFDCRVRACVSMSHFVHMLVTPGHAGVLARIALIAQQLKRRAGFVQAGRTSLHPLLKTYSEHGFGSLGSSEMSVPPAKRRNPLGTPSIIHPMATCGGDL